MFREGSAANAVLFLKTGDCSIAPKRKEEGFYSELISYFHHHNMKPGQFVAYQVINCKNQLIMQGVATTKDPSVSISGADVLNETRFEAYEKQTVIIPIQLFDGILLKQVENPKYTHWYPSKSASGFVPLNDNGTIPESNLYLLMDVVEKVVTAKGGKVELSDYESCVWKDVRKQIEHTRSTMKTNVGGRMHLEFFEMQRSKEPLDVLKAFVMATVFDTPRTSHQSLVRAVPRMEKALIELNQA